MRQTGFFGGHRFFSEVYETRDACETYQMLSIKEPALTEFSPGERTDSICCAIDRPVRKVA
jgi:hypothetical protein